MELYQKKNNVFKNFGVLTNRYIPPIFKHREEQIREIKNRLMPFFTFGFCENTIWLEGRPGLGKTHIVKHILKDQENFYLKPSKQSTCHSLFFGFQAVVFRRPAVEI